jgi:hypothetical protein
MPRIELGTVSTSTSSANQDSLLVNGVLMWNGSDTDVSRAFRTVFERDAIWWLARTAGELWTFDAELLASLGLSYELVEFQPGDTPAALLRHEHFLDRHGSELISLGQQLRRHASSTDRLGSVITTFGGFGSDDDGQEEPADGS